MLKKRPQEYHKSIIRVSQEYHNTRVSIAWWIVNINWTSNRKFKRLMDVKIKFNHLELVEQNGLLVQIIV